MKDESSDSLFVESAVIDADASLNTNKTDAPPKQMNETQDTITFDDKNMWTLPSDVFRSSDNRSRTEEEGLLLEYTKTLLTYYKVSECAPSRDANDGEEDDEVFALMKEKLMLENEVKEQQKRIQSSQALMVNIKNVEDTLLEGKRRQEELLAMLDRL
ncbi:hypothetical protein AGDE_17123 [Angomonas deanei]|nr:hypothetical protein AGDE_17123 [Angomonas deanei]|eukprot:EPY15433.1 hypothetical protein AGDE_17123 [Angomonas deanei]